MAKLAYVKCSGCLRLRRRHYMKKWELTDRVGEGCSFKHFRCPKCGPVTELLFGRYIYGGSKKIPVGKNPNHCLCGELVTETPCAGLYREAIR